MTSLYIKSYSVKSIRAMKHWTACHGIDFIESIWI